jgi:hypothetical protein
MLGSVPIWVARHSTTRSSTKNTVHVKRPLITCINSYEAALVAAAARSSGNVSTSGIRVVVF